MQRAMSRWDVLVAVCAAGMLFFLLMTTTRLTLPRADRTKCKSNLRQIGIGLALYQDNFGRGKHYPHENGSLFLVTVYRCRIYEETSLFLCPATKDDNQKGKAYGAGYAGDMGGLNATSYAGRINSAPESYPGIFSQKHAAQTTIGADDFDQPAGENHGALVNFLFLDAHCDTWDLLEDDVPSLREPLQN